MSDSGEFVIRRRRRRVRKTEPVKSEQSTSSTPVPPSSNVSNIVETDNVLPDYLINPPIEFKGVSGMCEKHTQELVCAYRVAKEVLGSSFRPLESNLAVGKIRL